MQNLLRVPDNRCLAHALEITKKDKIIVLQTLSLAYISRICGGAIVGRQPYSGTLRYLIKVIMYAEFYAYWLRGFGFTGVRFVGLPWRNIYRLLPHLQALLRCYVTRILDSTRTTHCVYTMSISAKLHSPGRLAYVDKHSSPIGCSLFNRENQSKVYRITPLHIFYRTA
jgi:hypothetical protein